MTSSTYTNRCQLLVLDIDSHRLHSDDLRAFFTDYGPIESIEIFPRFSAALIHFTSYLPVDRLVYYRTCFINENPLRLRRFRFDKLTWHIDCRILRVKLSHTRLTESLLLQCFEDYRSHILKVNVYPNNHALIFFDNDDWIDRILLLPGHTFQIQDQILSLERMIKRTRPIFSERDSVIEQLLNQIEDLSRQLHERSGNSREEIDRLEAELFIVKNENAQLKFRPSRLLADISNQIPSAQNYYKRSCSPSRDSQIKRRR